MDRLSVMGIVEVIPPAPELLSIRRQMKHYLRHRILEQLLLVMRRILI